MKKQTKKRQGALGKLEKEYLETFAPHPLPYQELYTDEDSLEQPSPLKVVFTTATPGVSAGLLTT